MYSKTDSMELPLRADSKTGDSVALDESPTQKNSHQLTWNGDDDIENPRNWPAGKKKMVVAYACAISVVVSMSVSLMTPAVPNISAQFHVGEVTANLGYSLFVSGWAVGPMIFGPLSEIYGRNAIYQPCWILYIAFQIGAAVAQNLQTMIICRFFSGLAGAPGIVNTSGTITDMFSVEQQGVPIGILLMVTYLAPTIGPIIGGYIAQYSSWRWTFWVSVISAGVLLVPAFLVPETHGQTILRRRAKKEGKEATKDVSVAGGRKLESRSHFIGEALTRPFKLLFRELLVFLSAFYIALISGILYLYFGAYPSIFRGVYNISQGNSGLPFFAISLGVIISLVTAGIGTKIYLKRRDVRGSPLAEDRLFFALPASVIAPISIFWLAWSCFKDVHWIAPTLSGIFFGWSFMMILICQLTYLADSYANVAASTLAAVFLLRSIFTVAFPLFAPAMNDRLGLHWSGSLLGFLTLACTPIPFLFYKFGPWIRQRSPYTFKGTF